MEAQRKFPLFGRHSYSANNSVTWYNPETTVGNFVSIGPNVYLGIGQHPTDWLSTHPFQYETKPFPTNKMYEPVNIGNDIWIGANAIIQDGVTICDGAIIATSAVVTKDVPPYAIVGGVPAKIIRYRFPSDIIEKLLILKWWDLPDEVIGTLPFDDINACIEKLEQIRKPN